MINYTDYKILVAEQPEYLEEYVQEALRDGWEPYGSVFTKGCKICREMVKVEQVTPEEKKAADAMATRNRIHGRGSSARG